MSGELFRREALEARKVRWLGGISLAQPLRPWLLAAFAVLAAALVVLFLVRGEYTRRTRVPGQLVPEQGMATVVSPATGVLARVDVPEGGRVAAGQILAVVRVPHATLAAGDTLAALEKRLRSRARALEDAHVARLQRLDAQTAGLQAQREAARRELAQIEREIATRREQVRLAGELLERLRGLGEKRYVSELQLKQQEAEALEQVGAMQVLERQALSTRRLITQLEQALAELPGERDAAEAGFRSDLARLEQERVEVMARGELAIVAPVSGVVATQMLKPGQAVQAGQALISVLPGDGRLEAELLVPSRAIGFIEPGDAVLLRYQAYPYQKFGHHRGTVARISRSTLQAGAGESAGEPFYRISVALERQAITAYGQAEPLRPGMLLEADVLGERRRLIEWALEPIYSVRGTVFGR